MEANSPGLLACHQLTWGFCFSFPFHVSHSVIGVEGKFPGFPQGTYIKNLRGFALTEPGKDMLTARSHALCPPQMVSSDGLLM